MAHMFNIKKKGPITVYANGLMLHIDLEDDNKLIATVESEIGGQQLDIHPHAEISNTIVFEMQKPSNNTSKSKFTLI